MKNLCDLMAMIEAREAEVLGQPPRLAPVDRKSAAAEVEAVTATLRSQVVGDAKSIALDQIPEIMFTFCRYPALWDAIVGLSLPLQNAAAVLPARERQLAILRTAWLLQAPYEWGEHVKHGRKIGFSDEDIDRLIAGSAAPGWDEKDRAIVRCCEELRENAMVTDETWAKLSEHLDDHQRFELLVLIGHFTNVAYFQNSLRLRLEPSNEGLRAR
ncbi:MAG: carboxymuconolactone decarboxylase family protein [Sphingomicrobium sp.]